MLSSVFLAAGDHIPSKGFAETEFTPWDTDLHEPPFVNQLQEAVISGYRSDNDRGPPKKNQSHGGPPPTDERKRRRMISNRESARRSRMRKQKHLENLRNQVTRHKTGNRELMNRLRFLSHHGQIIRQENDRLRLESMVLRQKLWDIHQVLLVRQLHNQLSDVPMQ